MMFCTLVILTIITTAFATPSFIREIGQPDDVPGRDMSLDVSWFEYKLSFNKTYQNAGHEKYRRIIWEDNLAIINKHNEEAAMGKHSYWMGVNQFTDMTENEFDRLMLSGLRQPSTAVYNMTDDEPWVTLPTSIDWRKKSLVTGIKDQGQCGSCWAFSATGSIEGQHAKKTGSLVSLSEQQLIDCSGRYGNNGCLGGLMVQAFMYVRDVGGQDTEQCYPYTAKAGTCRFKRSCIGAQIRSYKEVPEGENNLQKVVADVGPISVAVMATPNLQHYKSGIFTDTSCSPLKLNHGVLVVGYEQDYWIIKNSWGTRWGMRGYVQWAKNKGNMCGVASMASYPIV